MVRKGKITTPIYPTVIGGSQIERRRHAVSGTRKKIAPPPATRILGIDPGLAHLGYGVIAVVGREMAIVTHGTLRTERSSENRNADLAVRCSLLGQLFDAIVGSLSPPVDCAAIEAFSWQGKNVTSQIQLANVVGMLRENLRTRDIESHEYSTRDVKRCLTGNANAEKSQIQKMLQSMFALGAPPRPQHAADALAVAVTHALRLPTGNLLPI